MINALAVLLGFQLLGEVTVFMLHLPIPGPVVGMIFLFIILLLRREVPAALHTTAQGILRHLSLLYVPAGVGILSYLPLLEAEWLPMLITLIGSTLLTLLVTAGTMRLLMQRHAGLREDEGHDRA